MSAVSIRRGNILLDGRFHPGAVAFAGNAITAVEVESGGELLPIAPHIAPGLIDLQVNGAFGVEVGDDPDAIRLLARRLPESGVTAFLPTVVTAPADYYERAFAAFEAARDAAGSRPLGLHLEGPLLSPARKGAHRLELIEVAEPSLLDQFAASGLVKIVTLAPERPGVLPAIGRLREAGIVVSLGHTDAAIDQFRAGVDAGATMATHLFNAMSPFHHRKPGVIGAALIEDRVTVGLIPDGIHCHPAALQLAVRAKGWQRIAIVTDMMTAAGMPPGTYGLMGQQVTVDEESARLSDGTLAGSIIMMDEAVRNIVRWTETTPAQALSMASEVPARVLGLERTGRLAVGYDGDLTIFDEQLRVIETIIGGQTVYRREEA
ncbi:MAG: N-acetylglucosamine-6-phosphate deacetylase [Thermomicrobiales bacterium]